MNKVKRIGMVAVLALALSLSATGDADAALTLGATSIASDGAFTVDGAADSALTIGDAAQTAAISIGTSSATLAGLNIANGTGAATVNIATDNTAADTIAIGSAKDDVDLAGEDIALTSADDIHILGGSAGSIINVGTNADGNVINVGTDDTAADDINIGSAKDDVDLAGEDIALTSADDMSLLVGGAGGILNLATGTEGYTVNIATNNTTADTINIGSALDSVALTDADWSITTAGLITTAGDLAVNGDDITADGDLTVTGATGANVVATTGTLDLSASAGNVTLTSTGDTSDVVVTTGNDFTVNGVATSVYGIGTGNVAQTLNLGTGTDVDTINIGTGGGADVITIGGGAGTLAIDTANWDVSSAGAISGLTGLTVASGTVSLPAGEIGTAEIADAAITRTKMSTAAAAVHVQATSATIDTAAAAYTTYAIVPEAGSLSSADFSGVDALAADDTNYITFTITNKGQDGTGTTVMLDATDVNTTKASGGSAIVAKGKRALTLTGTSADLVVAQGDVLEISATVTGTLANTVTFPTYLLRFSGTN